MTSTVFKPLEPHTFMAGGQIVRGAIPAMLLTPDNNLQLIAHPDVPDAHLWRLLTQVKSLRICNAWTEFGTN